MNRIQLQDLAEERARDAAALLNAGQWSGAYYLAGYAVECGLKACIAKLTNQHDFPDKDVVQKSYIHKIETLLEVAGLVPQRNTDVATKPVRGNNWQVVKDWDEKARYQRRTELEARTLVSAVTDATDGVLTRTTGHW